MFTVESNACPLCFLFREVPLSPEVGQLRGGVVHMIYSLNFLNRHYIADYMGVCFWGD